MGGTAIPTSPPSVHPPRHTTKTMASSTSAASTADVAEGIRACTNGKELLANFTKLRDQVASAGSPTSPVEFKAAIVQAAVEVKGRLGEEEWTLDVAKAFQSVMGAINNATLTGSTGIGATSGAGTAMSGGGVGGAAGAAGGAGGAAGASASASASSVDGKSASKGGQGSGGAWKYVARTFRAAGSGTVLEGIDNEGRVSIRFESDRAGAFGATSTGELLVQSFGNLYSPGAHMVYDLSGGKQLHFAANVRMDTPGSEFMVGFTHNKRAWGSSSPKPDALSVRLGTTNGSTSLHTSIRTGLFQKYLSTKNYDLPHGQWARVTIELTQSHVTVSVREGISDADPLAAAAEAKGSKGKPGTVVDIDLAAGNVPTQGYFGFLGYGKQKVSIKDVVITGSACV